jgi:hypothetical protein
MKLSAIVVESLGAKGLVEMVRWTVGIAEQQHRRDATFDESARDRAEEQPTEALALDALKKIDLVEFTRITGHAAVVGRPFRKANQLAVIVVDDEAEPAAVV